MYTLICIKLPEVSMYPNAYSKGKSVSSHREADRIKLVLRAVPGLRGKGLRYIIYMYIQT
jgi:hypothetical protein